MSVQTQCGWTLPIVVKVRSRTRKIRLVKLATTPEAPSQLAMAVGENWSLEEVQATVMDYMTMLRFELLGQVYNKWACLEKMDTESGGFDV